MRWPCLLSILLVSGCGWFTKGVSTSLGDSKDNDVVVITSAKERAITYMSVDRDEKQGRRIAPKRIVCAEPSPDVATAVSDAIQSTLKAQVSKPGAGEAGLEAGYGRAFSESIAQLGTRLATIQLLRDELSDLCRAYANGAVSSITYTLRLSRLDKKMITLLIGEASAGALSRALVTVTGAGSNKGGVANKEKLDRADQRIKDATEVVSAANKELKAAVETRNTQTEEGKIKAADMKVQEAEASVRTRLAELNDRMMEKWALETQGSGLLAATNAGAIAALPTHPLPSSIDLGAIHRSFLDNDDLGTLIDACLTSLEENQELGSSPELDRINDNILLKRKELTDLKSKLDAAESSARAGARANPPNIPLNFSNLNEAIAFSKAQLELDDLLRKAEGMKGGRGSGLASFCRTDGMRKIVDLMDRKIYDKFLLESTAQMVDICTAAISAKSEKVLSECASGLRTLATGGKY